MKRYSTERDDLPFEFADGEFVKYEEAREIEVDREVKASNLEKLVDMVLAYEAASDELCSNTNIALEDMLNDAFDTAFRGILNLARGLKQ